MRTKISRGAVLSAVMCVVATGCATTNTDQLTSTIYQTHKIVRKMDNDLGGTINQLQQTAADLSARVDESDHETRRLQGLMEENQRKLDHLNNQLARLTRDLYQQLGLTIPTTVNPPPEGIMSSDTETEEGAAASESMMPPTGSGTEGGPAQPANAVTAYQQAQKSLINGDYETALKQYEDFLQRFPSTEYTHNAQFWKADCLLRLGDEKHDPELYEQAIFEFEKLRQNHPTSEKVPTAMHNQAAAHLRLGQTSRAAALLRDLVQHFPTTAAAERAKSKLQELEGE